MLIIDCCYTYLLYNNVAVLKIVELCSFPHEWAAILLHFSIRCIYGDHLLTFCSCFPSGRIELLWQAHT